MFVFTHPALAVMSSEVNVELSDESFKTLISIAADMQTHSNANTIRINTSINIEAAERDQSVVWTVDSAMCLDYLFD